jgi:hypothetical protein
MSQGVPPIRRETPELGSRRYLFSGTCLPRFSLSLWGERVRVRGWEVDPETKRALLWGEGSAEKGIAANFNFRLVSEAISRW